MSVSKIHFVFNERSGTVMRVGIDRMIRETRGIMGPLAGEMRPGPGQDIVPSVERLANAYAGQNHAIAIVAGDGGVVAAAGALMGRGLPLLPIAGGTHNIFVDQLGFNPHYIKSLRQALNHRVTAVDVGMVNEKPFLVGLALDPNSYNAFDSGEDNRDGKTLSAITKLKDAVAGALAGPDTVLYVKGNGEERVHTGKLAVISINRLGPQKIGLLDLAGAFTDKGAKAVVKKIAAKECLDGGELAFYAWNGDLTIKSSVLAGVWPHHASISRQYGREMTVSAVADEARETRYVRDGEPETTALPLKVSLVPKALNVLVPRS